MKASVFFIAFCMLAIAGFSQSKEFGWLVGTWKIPNKSIFETWKNAPDGNSLIGKSFRVKGADTVVTEEIKIVFKDNSFYYVPDVSGAQGPVLFKITQFTSVNFTAENPEHDFPKIIRYSKRESNTPLLLEATIEGGGKSISYSFEKLN